jgi:choline-sulfatase
MPASAPPPPPVAEDAGSFVVRFGSAVGLGAVAALGAVGPAAMRVAPAVLDGPGGTHVWLALATAALLPSVAAVVVLRSARVGLRAFAGPGLGLRIFGVVLWLSSLLVFLSLFGRVLRATTHHHGLAGVTFAMGALVAAVGSALVCGRIVAMARGAPEFGRRGLILLLSVGALLGLGFVGVHFVRAASQDAASYGAAGTVVDVLAFGLAVVLASSRALATRRVLAIVGPPVAVAVFALGFGTLRETPVRDAIGERAPAYAPVVDFLSSR